MAKFTIMYEESVETDHKDLCGECRFQNGRRCNLYDDKLQNSYYDSFNDILYTDIEDVPTDSDGKMDEVDTRYLRSDTCKDNSR